MKVVEMNQDLITRLRKSTVSKRMKSLEYCKFLVIEEENGEIVGASGIGGILNVHSIQLLEKAQGRGLGKTLFEKNIDEARKRGYSFIMVSRDPQNMPIVKLHDFFGFKPCFRIHYTHEMTRESLILVLKNKAKILKFFLSFFNTRIGSVILVVFLKMTKSSLFKKLLTYPPEEFPDPDVMYAIKNFEKI